MRFIQNYLITLLILALFGFIFNQFPKDTDTITDLGLLLFIGASPAWHAVLAGNRNRNVALWWFIGIFGSFVSLFFLWLLGKKEDTTQA